MKWKNLVEHQSESHPHLTFWYRPLKGREQSRRRMLYPNFGSPYELLASTFSDRLVAYRDDTVGETYSAEYDDQVIRNLHETVVLEMGAMVLGWCKSDDEDGTQFALRIRRELDEVAELNP